MNGFLNRLGKQDLAFQMLWKTWKFTYTVSGEEDLERQ